MTKNVNSKIIESYQVPNIDIKKRLSDFYTPGIFKTILSRKAMKNAIKNGLVKVNGKTGYTSNYILGGEIIDIYQNISKNNKPILDIALEIIYEDDYLAIINKPAGILVSGNKKTTVENALSFNLKKSTKEDALIRPEPIHRLDYPTSGALLIGKTSLVVMRLNKLFEERMIEKTYHAITIGIMPKKGIIDNNIDNKSAKTEFVVLNTVNSIKYKSLNLTELKPFSGRRHQLRKHMSEIGNPILGDKDYGIEGLINKGNGLFLHASTLKFVHPITNEHILAKVELPKKFRQLYDS